ncbi:MULTISPECIES: Tat pathway signal sequence [unclassified Actinobaculum]|uniref:Tat pathway signal sequence n=1 Tax=unclassified Actinobaculum TaxID=2609299 RepID=UPI000D526303|nr:MULTISPECIES: Tat pathway signal sequence [unclassified Actinobaculum]AWE42682.1 Tat pathway signal sequence [Actinobaculum sp. 313]RTE49490.1 Tat pathway signal sequence [Actinobaculum sp. 352]
MSILRCIRRRAVEPRRSSGLTRILALTAATIACYVLVACTAASPVPEIRTSAGAPAPSPSSGSSPARPATPLNTPLRGVTLDTLDDIDASVAVIGDSTAELTVRVVFDLDTSLAEYTHALEQLDPVAQIMMQIADSSELADMSAGDVTARTEAAITAFGEHVDIWEIGNEVNGAWVGTSPAEINPKVTAAYDAVVAHGGRTALTLNYWQSSRCYDHGWEDTLDYAATVNLDVDFVFLSVYETACSPAQQPTATELAETLNELGALFPQARLGIGEIGAQGAEDGLPKEPTIQEKTAIAERYYGMNAELSEAVGERFVGGYFWWYYYQDAVQTNGSDSLRETLDKLTSSL